ncbi:MAG: hypothetical protein AB8B72_04475 [Crocinitomicaceae bacterium]
MLRKELPLLGKSIFDLTPICMNWNRMSLFKLPSKSRDFNFHPRYYDERKERLKKKVQLYAGENKEEGRIRSMKFKAELEDSWGNSGMKRQTLRSNIRLIIILVLIIALFYYLFGGIDNVADLIKESK